MASTGSPRLTLLAAAPAAALALWPVVYLLIRAAEAGEETWRALARPSVGRAMWNSLKLAAAATSGAVLLGAPLAWLTSRTDLPGRRWWSVVLILPLALPSYIMAYSALALFGANGLASRALEAAGLPALPPLDEFGGAVFVMTFINYPFVLLSVRGALQRMDPALEEAARGLGCSRGEILRRVALPQLRPAIGAGGLLVALYALSDFGAPQLLRYKTFTQMIYTQYQSSFDRPSAAVTALVLVAFTATLLAAETAMKGRARFHRSAPAAQRPPPVVRLGPWRWPAALLCALIAAAGTGLPVFAMLYWIRDGMLHGQTPSIPLRAVWNSLLAAALAALAALAAALPMARAAARGRGWSGLIVDRAAYAGNALPGVVVALAFVFLGSRLLGIKVGGAAPLAWLYQSLPLLILAYVTRFLPEASGCVKAGMLQAGPRLEEAARGLGRSRAGAFFAVTLPMLRPSLATGGALVFLSAAKELPITLMLAPPGYDTLVGEVWWACSQGLFARASAPALLLVALSGLSVAVILRQERQASHGE